MLLCVFSGVGDLRPNHRHLGATSGLQCQGPRVVPAVLRVAPLGHLTVAVHQLPSPLNIPPAKRSVFQRVCAALGLTSDRPRTAAENTVAFTVAVISLSAKMAKSDGVASTIERTTFDLIFRAPAADVANVRRIFDLAAQDVAGFETYARQIAVVLTGDRALTRDVFDGLFHIAAADGILHPAEESYLQTVAAAFGLSATEYRTTRSQFVVDRDNSVDDPYRVLGLKPDASNDTLRSRFKQLVRENHPDLAMARGVPPEFVDLATRKLASINVAYDKIAMERGI
jgi:DnaJ like chaperone protein